MSYLGIDQHARQITISRRVELQQRADYRVNLQEMQGIPRQTSSPLS